MEEAGGNPGRSGHRMAMRAAEILCECRENLATLFSVDDPLCICFAANATEALNLALKGSLKPGDHVVYSSMEHNSVWRPLVKMETCGVKISMAEADKSGIVSPAAIDKVLQPNTVLIAVTHASNVNGAVNPIAGIGEIARKKNILFLVDAAQTAGVLPIDVHAMNIDLLAFPGHKGLLGPQGTGGLYVGRRANLDTIKEGGTGSNSASSRQPDLLPDRYESGTMNTPGIAGLNEGVKYVLGCEIEKISRRERSLAEYLLDGLGQIDGVCLYGPRNLKDHIGVVSFNLRKWDCEQVAEQLDLDFQIACRAGLHCAYLAHKSQGTEKTGAVRFSLSPFVSQSDIGLTLEAIRELSQRSNRTH
jgi:cysteine desulfurase / selenocysteine lyase